MFILENEQSQTQRCLFDNNMISKSKDRFLIKHISGEISILTHTESLVDVHICTYELNNPFLSYPANNFLYNSVLYLIFFYRLDIIETL